MTYELPVYWNDPVFNGHNQPVIVTWFEALAYCSWLSEILDMKFRLPNEMEWEVASRGNEEQEYANTLEGLVLRTTPIGVFQQGVSVLVV
ncbi:MAG TPA: SUMF1/EgtB/PvdO family nonheme iron enzyme [Anaerolineales bacterium]|nr:SUMF1/EgtB/PvdO family nonheme iron enzyme [Anaerolineales bacterium]